MFESAHHSTEAREMMQPFYVGQYVEVGKTVFQVNIQQVKTLKDDHIALQCNLSYTIQ